VSRNVVSNRDRAVIKGQSTFMKITDIKATTVTVPLEAPLRHVKPLA